MNNNNIIQTIRELIADATLLVRQEIDLAKAEAAEKFGQIQAGVAAVAAGSLIALVALLVLVQALVVALGNIMPPALAALVVGVVLALIAFVLVMNGANQLKPENLAPKRTIRSVRENAEKMKEGRSS
ncbi:phage holin family protein [Hoeflea sp. WL0058]|uniref:Phage holin family protein n=1 Tax=Flavimaribacter sediminis TaxID=2865987 RepID=A0AAE2ZHC1_9HYPH|nr:phage holin family protein [Flavimaribacter sediminis]MBW8636679.1 phage holin family protein [Flavimaribacter sediminis]